MTLGALQQTYLVPLRVVGLACFWEIMANASHIAHQPPTMMRTEAGIGSSGNMCALCVSRAGSKARQARPFRPGVQASRE